MSLFDDALAAVRPMIVDALREVLAEHAAAEPHKPELLTQADLCAAIQISRATLHRLRGDGLPTIIVGDSPRFRLADVLAWLAARQA